MLDAIEAVKEQMVSVQGIAKAARARRLRPSYRAPVRRQNIEHAAYAAG